MLRSVCLLLLAVTPALAAERFIDLIGVREGELPPGFRSTMGGTGQPPEWKVALDELPLVVEPLSSKSPVDSKRPVLAQLSTDKSETRAPMLILDTDNYHDFTFSTRVKILGGEVEQMAGIAFRYQNEKNYYYVRLNPRAKNVSFFRYVEGELIGPISAPVNVALGEWNTLAVECQGARLRVLLNDKPALPWTEPNYVPFPDGTSKGVFTYGKIGFWTKADTVAHFADSKLAYTPREPFAQMLVRETLAAHPRLLGLKIFALKEGETIPRIIASDKADEIGTPGEKTETDCIEKGGNYTGKGKQLALVTMPLHDRNGEAVGAVRVVLDTFFGQTEKNMLARALPIVKSMEGRVASAAELRE